MNATTTTSQNNFNDHSRQSSIQQNEQLKQTESENNSFFGSLRSLFWRRRNVRPLEIHNDDTTKSSQLSTILARATHLETTQQNGRRRGARALVALIHALAEEVRDLDVSVDARPDTPLWGKRVDAVRIQFSRLGFQPLHMGGLDPAFYRRKAAAMQDTVQGAFTMDRQFTNLSCPDEAFERMDVDQSGALDQEEIAQALTLAAKSANAKEKLELNEVLRTVAADLVALYDFNGDGVVDRNEYQSMVEDMAALREAQDEKRNEELERIRIEEEGPGWTGSALNAMRNSVGFAKSSAGALASYVAGFFGGNQQDEPTVPSSATIIANDAAIVVPMNNDSSTATDCAETNVENVSRQEVENVANSLGSIVLTDLKLDLRRLLFGAVPFLNKITPGGPLVLEPFSVTVTASFDQEDIKKSFLLNAGLRRLVAQVLRRRVRSFRDFVDGAVFFGRDWKMASASAPVVKVVAIENVEFTPNNKMVLTGRVQVQTRPEQAIVESAFKLRARLGTNTIGRRIKLVDPELAIVAECPKWVEEGITGICDVLSLDIPQKPDPLYFFFPLQNPMKMVQKSLRDPIEAENDGYDLGDDNQIHSIYIKDKALRFELSCVLRPGRFLGNHYLAFTVPNKTLIITWDRVKEGIRAARRARQAAQAMKRAVEKKERKLPKELQVGKPRLAKKERPKNFFSRFVNGYMQAERDEKYRGRVTTAIKEFFGKQGRSDRSAADGNRVDDTGRRTSSSSSAPLQSNNDPDWNNDDTRRDERSTLPFFLDQTEDSSDEQDNQ
jgi:Ca2+-binding EF-hand superfamily protein